MTIHSLTNKESIGQVVDHSVGCLSKKQQESSKRTLQGYNANIFYHIFWSEASQTSKKSDKTATFNYVADIALFKSSIFFTDLIWSCTKGKDKPIVEERKERQERGLEIWVFILVCNLQILKLEDGSEKDLKGSHSQN